MFSDRYHATIIQSPRQARHELAYVLNNWRKHGEHRKDGARDWKIDPFATGWLFQEDARGPRRAVLRTCSRLTALVWEAAM